MSKKLSVFTLIIAIALIFSGCGNKPEKSSQNTDNSQKSVAEEDSVPAPTGKIDDTVNAIIDESNKENNLVSGADSVAKDAVNDSQETDDFVKAYDENEF
jgi:PBP1b-binding outer membrane lipoprotein LpoB